jgi:hypothetical protein
MRFVTELKGRKNEVAALMRRERLLGYPYTLSLLCRAVAWAAPPLSNVAAAVAYLADVAGARARDVLRSAAEAEQRQQTLAMCMQHVQNMLLETPLARMLGDEADEELAKATGLAAHAFGDAPPELRDALRHASARAASARAMARLACVSTTLRDAAAATTPSQGGVTAAAARLAACEQARQMHKLVHLILVAHDTALLDKAVLQILVSYCNARCTCVPPAPYIYRYGYYSVSASGVDPESPPAVVWCRLFEVVEAKVTAVQQRYGRRAAEALNTWPLGRGSPLFTALAGPISDGGSG